MDPASVSYVSCVATDFGYLGILSNAVLTDPNLKACSAYRRIPHRTWHQHGIQDQSPHSPWYNVSEPQSKVEMPPVISSISELEKHYNLLCIYGKIKSPMGLFKEFAQRIEAMLIEVQLY